MPRYRVTLTPQELRALEALTRRGKTHARRFINARVAEDGFEAALDRKPREKPPREVIFDEAFEARLIALACSDTPEGHRRWTVRRLADKAVELNIAAAASHMTVQRILKKSNLNLTSESAGKCPRKAKRHL